MFVAHLGACSSILKGFRRVLGVVLSVEVLFQSRNKMSNSICSNPRTSKSVLPQSSPAGTFVSEGVTLYFKNAAIKYMLFQSRRNSKLLQWEERCNAVIEILSTKIHLK